MLNMFLANVPPQLPDVAFTIGNVDIKWYAIILTTAMLIALFVLYKLAKTKKFTADFILEVFLWTIPLAVIAARLGYCAPRPEYWDGIEGLKKLVDIRSGGLTILSGIFGGLLGIFIACKHKKVALFDVVDLVVPALLFGQAFGRWGNFMNEELYGVAITDPNLQFFPFAVYIHKPVVDGMILDAGWYAANFFYESVMNLFMAILIVQIIRRGKNKPGEISALYLMWYGLLRGILEFIKLGAYKLGGVIGGAQMFSFGCAIVGLILFILIKTGKIRLKNTKQLREKKGITVVKNDAFLDGTFDNKA